MKRNHVCNLASWVIYVGKLESCLTGEYSCERYYKWHDGWSPAFWHLALITDVPHVKRTKYIHAQRYILTSRERKAREFLTAVQRGNEQLRAHFPLLSRALGMWQ